jgi:hypothetical protein
MILGQSLSDDAVLTFSSQVDTLPAAAVQRVQPRDLWRSFDNADQWLVFDLGTTTTFNAVAALYHNGDSTFAKWRVRTAATEIGLTTSPSHDSGVLSMFRGGLLYDRYSRLHSVHTWAGSSLRWCRVDFTGLSALTALDLGRLMICNAVTDSPQFGVSVTSEHDVEPTVTSGGLWQRSARKSRTMNFSFQGLPDDNAWVQHGPFEPNLDKPLVASITERHTGERDVDWTIYGFVSNISTTYLYENINMKTYSIQEMERP